MRRIIIMISISFLLFNCTPNVKYQEVKNELEKVKLELENCKKDYEKIKNTPEQSLITANRFLSEEKLSQAKIEFQTLISNYQGTKEAKIAKSEIAKIDKIIDKNKKLEERKKALGFKILKESTKFKAFQTNLSFSRISISKRWTFDSYGDRYHYRDAERGDKHIVCRVSISSESKNPKLPPILAYNIKNGKLNYLGRLSYEFTRWKDYGAYLGNYADYGNDFAHSKSVPFSLGLSVSEKEVDDEPVFLVVGKYECFYRVEKDYGSPEVEYRSSCDTKYTLTVDDFDNSYGLIKIFNKSNL